MAYLQDFVINVVENVSLQYSILKNYWALFNSYNYYNEKRTQSLYNTRSNRISDNMDRWELDWRHCFGAAAPKQR